MSRRSSLGAATATQCWSSSGTASRSRVWTASQDMLDRCRHRAQAGGLVVTLHRQLMQRMDLAKRYNSMYLAGATFNLLADDDAPRQTLERIRVHLTSTGTALVPLVVPSVNSAELMKEQVDDQGSVIRFVPGASSRDELRRQQRTVMRYERVRLDGATERLEREWLLHWYPRRTFRELADHVGLDTVAVIDLEDPAGHDEVFAFILRRRA